MTSIYETLSNVFNLAVFLVERVSLTFTGTIAVRTKLGDVTQAYSYLCSIIHKKRNSNF